MAFTFKKLKGLGIEEDKIEIIMEEHNETIRSIKEDKDKYQEQVAEMETLKDELKKAKETIETYEKGDYQALYEKEHADFEAYKNDIKVKAEKVEKENAYKNLLKKAGIIDSAIDKVLKVSDLKGIEIENGNVKGSEEIIEGIKTEWGDLIAKTSTHGANTQTPPANSEHKMTKEEIMGIKDSVARQKAIAENMDLFGYN